jgi:mRNA interferase MazF
VEPLAAGVVALVPFPFSDLSGAKTRPVVVLADAGRGDFLLCQVTSNRYSDPFAIELTGTEFEEGSLRRVSYVRPGRIFTAHASLMRTRLGALRPRAHARLVERVVALVQASLRS